MPEKTKKKQCEEALDRLRTFVEKKGNEEAKKAIEVLAKMVPPELHEEIKIGGFEDDRFLGTCYVHRREIFIHNDFDSIVRVEGLKPGFYNSAPLTKRDVIIHEVGHFLQACLSEEYVNKFEEIKGKEFHPGRYNVQGKKGDYLDLNEDFAHSFSRFLNHTKIFKESFPLRFEYFSDLGLGVEIKGDTVRIVDAKML